MTTDHAKMPALFIPHGGGPCFFMDWSRGPADSWDKTAAYLRSILSSLPEKPKGIVVVSGHWEEPQFTVATGAHPSLIYDYYGFPEHTYALRYDAPGAPALAERVRALLTAAGIASASDAARGWDHGVFIPLKVAFPEADIPVVQLSLKSSLDPAEHRAAGRALQALREEGVLILGSGMSFHNMRGFGDPRFTPVSEAFDSWLTTAVSRPERERGEALAHWSEAPGGRLSHPREEHLIPLMVVAGASDEPGAKVFSDRVMETTLSAFQFP